jgi:hypothetical protein
MSERRQAFRVSTLARIAARPVAKGGEALARMRVAARSAPDVGLPFDDAVSLPEERIQIDLLQRILSALGRLEQRLDRLADLQRGDRAEEMPFSPLVPISLSAVGLSGPLDIYEPEGALIEVMLDVLDPGIPIIPAVASIVRTKREAGEGGDDAELVAIHFVEITEMDRERLFHYSLRLQRQSLQGRGRSQGE